MNESYMETRLYNDVGAKRVKDPKYYLVAVMHKTFKLILLIVNNS
jgi:hypothetical protein